MTQTKGITTKPDRKFDLYTFVAGAAVEGARPFPLTCSCGGVVTIMPPFQDEYVVCARCESKIKMIEIDGDPGYIIGAESDGTPKLLPVQGGTAPHPSSLSEAQRESILAQVRAQIAKRSS